MSGFYKYNINDVIEYDYQSSGYWRTVHAVVLDRTYDDYTVEILKVVEGEPLLSGGTKLVGKKRSPTKDWIERRATLVSSSSPLPPFEREKQDRELDGTSLINRGEEVEVTAGVKNVEELFEATGLDPYKWDVSRFTVSVKEGTEDAEGENQYQVWARLQPKPLGEFQAADWQGEFLDRVASTSPVKPVAKAHPEHDTGGLLSEINLSDAHLRMLSWEKETGVNYDLKIATKLLRDAGFGLLETSLGLGVDRIKLVVGNDMFHCDSNAPFTKRGNNLLDVDGRYAKGFEEGFAVIRDIVTEALDNSVPVDILPIPGNHDAETVYFLGQTLAAYFHADDRVLVDTTPKPRKYYRWGKCLVGLEHGDRVKKKEMPMIMSKENPDVSWDSHPFREMHFGHIHTEIACDEKGTVLRWVNALPPADYWHFQEGYVGNVKGSQAFIFDKNKGLTSILYHRVDY